MVLDVIYVTYCEVFFIFLDGDELASSVEFFWGVYYGWADPGVDNCDGVGCVEDSSVSVEYTVVSFRSRVLCCVPWGLL